MVDVYYAEDDEAISGTVKEYLKQYGYKVTILPTIDAAKHLRTANLSLTILFLAFTLTMCFFTLTAISQRMTCFVRYQDSWDVMATVKGTQIDTFEETAALQALSGAQCLCISEGSSKDIYNRRHVQ